MTNSWVWRDEPGECGACGILIQSDQLVVVKGTSERIEACSQQHATMMLRGEQVPEDERPPNWRVQRMRLRIKSKKRKN